MAAQRPGSGGAQLHTLTALGTVPGMPDVLTVSQITRQVRDLLEAGIGTVWVEGEVSNYRRQSSGHHYFTLKDDRAQLACVMFARAYAGARRVPLADGMHLQALGELTVYETRGQYQLVVELIQAKGLGALQAKFEALKARLQAEGLFEAGRKRPLPTFPSRVALVTSPTGAAIQDMLHILGRRSPWLRVLVCPVRVQGEGAAAEIAAAIREVSERASELGVQVLIVGRGGGSFEDLWEFNEEAVARAIYEAKIPVISAVGHEIDFTIADFVADLRAPTPSAAAELVAPEVQGLSEHLRRLQASLERNVRQALEIRRLHLRQHSLSVFLREPRRLVHEREQRLDGLEARLQATPTAALGRLRERVGQLRSLVQAFRPDGQLEFRRQRFGQALLRFATATAGLLVGNRERLVSAIRHLQMLGPQQTLNRGYTITRDEAGRLVTRTGQVVPGSCLRTQLTDGEVVSWVEG